MLGYIVSNEALRVSISLRSDAGGMQAVQLISAGTAIYPQTRTALLKVEHFVVLQEIFYSLFVDLARDMARCFTRRKTYRVLSSIAQLVQSCSYGLESVFESIRNRFV